MNNIQQLPDDCFIKFEVRRPWRGSYAAARRLQEDTHQGSRFRFLEDQSVNRCATCLQDFVAEDQLTILPCTHRFHQQCLQNVQRLDWRIDCPIDMQREENVKISWLGHSILSPFRRMPPSAWISQKAYPFYERTLSRQVKELFHPKTDLNTEALTQAAISREADFISEGIPGLLKEFGDAHSDHLCWWIDGAEKSHQERVANRLAILSPSLERKFIEARGNREASFPPELIHRLLPKLGKMAIQFLYSKYRNFFNLNEDEIAKGFLHIQRKVQEELNSPIGRQYIEELNQRTCFKHLKSIRELSSTAARFFYLSQLDAFSLRSLYRFAQRERGPTSLFLQKGILLIQQSRLVKDQIQSKLRPCIDQIQSEIRPCIDHCINQLNMGRNQVSHLVQRGIEQTQQWHHAVLLTALFCSMIAYITYFGV